MTAPSLVWQDNRLLLSGPVTMASATPLLAQLGALLAAAKGPEVVLDGGQMTSSDSTAIALLVEMHRKITQSGGSLRVEGLREQMVSLITIYGVDWIMGNP